MGHRRRTRRHSWIPIEMDPEETARLLNGSAIQISPEDARPKLNGMAHFDTKNGSVPHAKNGDIVDGLSDTGRKSKYAGKENQQSNGNFSFSKLFQASTYFPISQKSPMTRTPVASKMNGTSHIPPATRSLINSISSEGPPKQPDENVIHRLLEHLAVGFYVFGFVFSPLLLTIASLTIIFFPPLWFIAIPYFCWYIYDYRTPTKGSRPWHRFRSLKLWKYMASYFPMKLIKTVDLPADRNYIVGCHPHGILSFGTFLAFCTEAVGFAELFPGVQRRYAVTLPVQYWFPLRRELLMLTNTISSEVSAIEHVLQENEQGCMVGIVPGGAAEALDSSSNNFKLTLKNRKGFVKLALKYGSSLIPMYTFGETSTFKQAPNPEGSLIRKFQNSLKGLTGCTMPFFYGCGFVNRFFGFMPFRTPLYSVIGKPIYVEKVKDPTNAQVNELHKRYCRELSNLFDTHKQKYGISPKVKLEFV